MQPRYHTHDGLAYDGEMATHTPRHPPHPPTMYEYTVPQTGMHPSLPPRPSGQPTEPARQLLVADNGADGPWVLPRLARAAMPAVSNSQSRLVTFFGFRRAIPKPYQETQRHRTCLCPFPATNSPRMKTKRSGCPGGSVRGNEGGRGATSIRSSFSHPLLTALRSERQQVPRRISRADHVRFLLFQARVA